MDQILTRPDATHGVDPRRLAGDALAAALRDSRRRTLSLVEDLSDAQWRVPQQDGVNLVAWELSHLAWFGEFWILRGPHRVGDDGFVHAGKPARIAGPDALFDSARLAHAARWEVELPSRTEVLGTLRDQLDACLEALPSNSDDADLYFHRLTLFHEDMHGEAFAWLRASMGYAAPEGASLQPQAQGTVLVPEGVVRLGAPDGAGFAFDNELSGHERRLPAFEIDAAPITIGRFLQFVEAGGYENAAFWPGAAGEWRSAHGPRHPARWRRGSDGWALRWFDRWLPLDPAWPVIHVNAFEAEAFCLWADRQLPSAAQWQAAARQPGFHWGHSVWEWTSDAFLPYDGFRPGPYKDYSAPWFGNHRELRGGAFATHARMHATHYRNFFMPHRHDVFAGFRTVATRGVTP
jgi:ergothioneine biosynthesis protein EgtB